MALPSSGAISLLDIQNEFGGNNPIGINEYYGVASGVPASGTISFDDFYGTSAGLPPVSIGYYMGGQTPGPVNGVRDIYRIQYSNDTLSTLPNALPTFQSRGGVVEDTSNAFIVSGLTAAGSPSGQYTNNVMKFQFSNQTGSDLPVNFPSPRQSISGVSSPTNGYFCGGFTGFFPATTNVTTVQRMQFSNNTFSTIPNSLPTGRNSASETESTSTGYIFEGSPQPPTYSPSIIKLNFSSETFSTLGTTPVLAMQFENGAFSDRSNGYGYFFGGFKGISPLNPGPVQPPPPGGFYSDAVEKIVFSTDTMSLLPATTPIVQRNAEGNMSDNAGYISGGLFADGCEVQKFVFSTETFTSPAGGFTGTPSSPSSTRRNFQHPTRV